MASSPGYAVPIEVGPILALDGGQQMVGGEPKVFPLLLLLHLLLEVYSNKNNPVMTAVQKTGNLRC